MHGARGADLPGADRQALFAETVEARRAAPASNARRAGHAPDLESPPQARIGGGSRWKQARTVAERAPVRRRWPTWSASRRQVRRPAGARAQGRRRVGRRHLRRVRRGRQRDRPRPDRPRAPARRQGRDPRALAAGVDVRELRHHGRRRACRSRSTRRTPPRSATTCSSTPRRGRCSSRTRSSSRRSARSGTSCRSCARSCCSSRASADDAITLDELRERGRDRDAEELEARTAAVTRTTRASSSTRPAPPARPRAASSAHGNYREVRRCPRHGAS